MFSSDRNVNNESDARCGVLRTTPIVFLQIEMVPSVLISVSNTKCTMNMTESEMNRLKIEVATNPVA